MPRLTAELKAPLALPPLSGSELLANAWSDEEIGCYTIAGSPGGRGPYTAHLFDIRMRRWYTISADHHVVDPDPSWDHMEDPYWYGTLKKTGHRGRDDFSHIDVDPVTGSLSLSLLPAGSHGQCPNLLDPHPPPPNPVYPHVHFAALQDRKYLDYPAETCTWGGDLYVFKQIVLSNQVPQLDAEISALGRLTHSLHIVKIIAYVVDDDGDLRGILLPWVGTPIDTLPSVRWTHFRDVVYGLRDIHNLMKLDSEQQEMSHGDVYTRNILVKDGVTRLMDLDNPGYDYPGDVEALADVINSLKDKAEGETDRERMAELEGWLRAGMAFMEIAAKIKTW